jgi:hypothetical protein
MDSGNMGWGGGGGYQPYHPSQPFDANPDSPVRTIIIHGFPNDASEREIFNLLRTTCHGFGGQDNLNIMRKPEQIIVFAKFIDHSYAFSAIQRLHNFMFDMKNPSELLRVFFAKADLNMRSSKRTSDDISGFQDHSQVYEKRSRYNDGESHQQRGQSAPCKSLFIGAIPLGQIELESFFITIPGFVKLTIGKPGSYSFAEFDSIQTATDALVTYDKHMVAENAQLRLSYARKDSSSSNQQQQQQPQQQQQQQQQQFQPQQQLLL